MIFESMNDLTYIFKRPEKLSNDILICNSMLQFDVFFSRKLFNNTDWCCLNFYKDKQFCKGMMIQILCYVNVEGRVRQL